MKPSCRCCEIFTEEQGTILALKGLYIGEGKTHLSPGAYGRKQQKGAVDRGLNW